MSGYSRLYNRPHRTTAYDNNALLTSRPTATNYHYPLSSATTLSPLWTRSPLTHSTSQYFDNYYHLSGGGDDMSAARRANNPTTTATQTPKPAPRKGRYARSNTSVTQLLTDSCSSLFNRIATRVRGPSANVDSDHSTSSSTSTSTSTSTSAVASTNSSKRIKTPTKTTTASNNFNLGSTRSRLEDKYSNVLNRIARRRNKEREDSHEDHEKTIEPSSPTVTTVPLKGNSLIKSATTANVFSTDKSYPHLSKGKSREKTPYRKYGGVDNYYRHNSLYYSGYTEPSYYGYLEYDSPYYQNIPATTTTTTSTSTHKSKNKSDKKTETNSARSSYTRTVHKKEKKVQRCHTTNFLNKLYPVEIPDSVIDSKTNINSAKHHYVSPEATPTPNDFVQLSDNDTAGPDEISEREAKRKEIQSLIMKYSALDEAYNRSIANATLTLAGMPAVSTSTAAAPQQNNKTVVPISSHMYQPHKDMKMSSKMTSIVSRRMNCRSGVITLAPPSITIQPMLATATPVVV